MVKISMSIDWDNTINKVNETIKRCDSYDISNLANTFEKFVKSIGGEHGWYKVVEKITNKNPIKRNDEDWGKL